MDRQPTKRREIDCISPSRVYRAGSTAWVSRSLILPVGSVPSGAIRSSVDAEAEPEPGPGRSTAAVGVRRPSQGDRATQRAGQPEGAQAPGHATESSSWRGVSGTWPRSSPMSRMQQVIDALEAERAEVQEHLAWLDHQISEFHAHNGGSPAGPPAGPHAARRRGGRASAAPPLAAGRPTPRRA